MPEHSPPAASPTGRTPRERDHDYYALLAGGARTRLLEAFLDLGLPELLGGEGPLSAATICRRLGLDFHRGWKFLHLVAMSGLLVEQGGELGDDSAIYALSPVAREYFGEDGKEGYFFRDLVTYWRNVAELPVAAVLRGMPLPRAVRWPPPGPAEAEHLEGWMRVTAAGAIRTLVRSGVVAPVRRLLDVGGGDGTIGCALVQEYPGLEVTVFNLPASAAIAERTILERGCQGRVVVHEGDFLQDELPGGFDGLLFSRVLTDWAPKVCLELLQKARRAIVPGGRLIINEALIDGNEDYAISWEFRYLFYDTFGRATFKTRAVYERLLSDAGFAVASYTPMIDDAFYCVLEAVPAPDENPREAAGARGSSHTQRREAPVA